MRIDSGSLRRCVEGVELHLVIVPAGMQAVKVGPAIDAQQHGLAIDHKQAVSVTQRGLGDQREAIALVVTVAGP